MDKSKLVDLDDCVVSALELFTKEEVPKVELNYKRPLVVGSGNAAVTGKIIFEGTDAVFADEDTYQEKVETIPEIDGALLISASGEKHAPIIAKWLTEKGINTTILTCNPNASSKEFADKFYVSPKQTEPYTYNTSTYMGMILAKTGEDPAAILKFIREKIDPLIPNNFKDFKAYYILVDAKYDSVRELFMTKFDELFGPMVNGRVFTPEKTKHAKTVIPWDKEIFISLGYDNKVFGVNKLNFPLPSNAGPATVMAVGYYIIGKMQKQNEPYFRDNIEKYCKDISEIFGSEIKPIVE